MKFLKGMVIGAATGAAMGMMYSNIGMNPKKLMKKGKKFVKKIGLT